MIGNASLEYEHKCPHCKLTINTDTQLMLDILTEHHFMGHAPWFMRGLLKRYYIWRRAWRDACTNQ